MADSSSGKGPPTEQANVFFYGLFMDQSLLASKGFSASRPTIGYVDGFSLRIGKRAALIPESSSRTYGVLMKMASADVSTLYSDPSVADYRPEPVAVHLPGNIQVAAVCYNLPPGELTGANPEYGLALLELATRLGLPDSHLQCIRSEVDKQ